MTDASTPADRRYRLLDAASKLTGLALVAIGLDIGGGTPAGLTLAVAGAICATVTVFLSNE